MPPLECFSLVYQFATNTQEGDCPKIITDENLWQEPDQDFDEFIDMLKPFRDSLVHPSPFATHTRSGSYDKLRMFYRIDYENGILTAKLLVKLLKRIELHIHNSVDSFPDWLKQLDSHIQNTIK